MGPGDTEPRPDTALKRKAARCVPPPESLRQHRVMADDQRAAHLREWARMLPEVSEGLTVHHPSLKIRGKAFVMSTDGGADPSLWVKSDLTTQAELIAADPERYFRPPYVGHHGWVGVRTDDDVDWAEVGELVTDAFRLAAPKRLVARLDAET